MPAHTIYKKSLVVSVDNLYNRPHNNVQVMNSPTNQAHRCLCCFWFLPLQLYRRQQCRKCAYFLWYDNKRPAGSLPSTLALKGKTRPVLEALDFKWLPSEMGPRKTRVTLCRAPSSGADGQVSQATAGAARGASLPPVKARRPGGKAATTTGSTVMSQTGCRRQEAASWLRETKQDQMQQ